MILSLNVQYLLFLIKTKHGYSHGLNKSVNINFETKISDPLKTKISGALEQTIKDVIKISKNRTHEHATTWFFYFITVAASNKSNNANSIFRKLRDEKSSKTQQELLFELYKKAIVLLEKVKKMKSPSQNSARVSASVSSRVPRNINIEREKPPNVDSFEQNLRRLPTNSSFVPLQPLKPGNVPNSKNMARLEGERSNINQQLNMEMAKLNLRNENSVTTKIKKIHSLLNMRTNVDKIGKNLKTFKEKTMNTTVKHFNLMLNNKHIRYVIRLAFIHLFITRVNELTECKRLNVIERKTASSIGAFCEHVLQMSNNVKKNGFQKYFAIMLFLILTSSVFNQKQLIHAVNTIQVGENISEANAISCLPQMIGLIRKFNTKYFNNYKHIDHFLEKYVVDDPETVAIVVSCGLIIRFICKSKSEDHCAPLEKSDIQFDKVFDFIQTSFVSKPEKNSKFSKENFETNVSNFISKNKQEMISYFISKKKQEMILFFERKRRAAIIV